LALQVDAVECDIVLSSDILGKIGEVSDEHASVERRAPSIPLALRLQLDVKAYVDLPLAARTTARARSCPYRIFQRGDPALHREFADSSV
jgi:hypothetical protein